MKYFANGLRALSDTKIVMDTNTFLRALAEVTGYVEALNTIKKFRHIIIASKEIVKEYEGRAKIFGTRYMLNLRIIELKNSSKLEIIKRSRIQGKLHNLNLRRMPSHKRDSKFVILAAVECAKYILSKDHHLLDLHPYHFDDNHVDILEPLAYVEEQVGST